MRIEETAEMLDDIRDQLRRGAIELSEGHRRYTALRENVATETPLAANLSLQDFQGDRRAFKAWLVRDMADLLIALTDRAPSTLRDLNHRGYQIRTKLFDRDGDWSAVYGPHDDTAWPSVSAPTRLQAITLAKRAIDRIVDRREK